MARRRRSNTTRYLGEREARGMVALDNAARSGKTEAHNRRKPGLDSTGNPELQTNAADGRVLAPASVSDGHVNGQFGKDKISGNGRFGPRDISVPGLTDNPEADGGKAIDVASFKKNNQDVNQAIASRATNAEVNNALSVAQGKTTASQVKALIKKHVKKQSTQRL